MSCPGYAQADTTGHDATVTFETAAALASRNSDVGALPAAERLPSEFGGYRVVRVLSRSEWVTTAVVHAPGETRVARIFSTACPTAIIDNELAAHSVVARAEPVLREHAVALHDLVTLPDGRLALILDLASGPALDDVLVARRGHLAIGEAITILAPLADALEAAHGVGLTGVAFTTAHVRFSAAGAPVVVRLTDARPGPVLPDRFRALEPAYVHDTEMFQQLGAAVTAAVVDADRPGLAATLAAPRRARPLSAALFDLAPPVPVLLHASVVADGERVPAVSLNPAVPGLPAEPAPPTPVTSMPSTPSSALVAPTGAPAAPRCVVAALDTLAVLGLPTSLVERVRAVAERSVARVASSGVITAPVIERLRAVRRGYVIAGAGGIVALVAALALVATGAGTGTGAEVVSVTESSGGASEPPAEEGARNNSLSTTSAASESSTRALDVLEPESLVDPSPDEWPAIADELIERWLECHAALANADPRVDLGCVSEVVHAGSAAERLIGDSDSRHVTLERWHELGGESVVVERMGGAALIDLLVPAANSTTAPATRALTTAASLLVVRSEAGWRVRDVLVDDPVD